MSHVQLFLLSAALCAPLLAQAADAPHVKPVKLTADAAKAAKAAPEAHPAAAGSAQTPTSAAAVAAAAAAAPPPVDPLEMLRQRLAGKLAGGRITEANGPYDLRLVAKRAASASTAAGTAANTAASTAASTVATHARLPRTAAPGKAGKAGTAAPAAEVASARWDYQGTAGPQTWGGLKPEFTLCGSGQRQSPIDIRGGLAVDLDPVKFSYQATPFGVIDNGHTVQANVAQGNHIELGGKRYELVQFHFHRPSEERIDGRQFEMSLHLVHKDEQGRLAVVAVLMDKGLPQPAVQRVWNNLPLEKGEELSARVPLELSELLPTDRRYYTYMGSLTTPPCSEGVQWVVMRQPVSMSAEQIELFARMYPMNARPVQQVSGRRILQSQ